MAVFNAQHHDNAPITSTIVSYNEAQQMAVFYRRLGYMVGIDEPPVRPGIRIAGNREFRPRAPGKPKLTRQALADIIMGSSATTEEKLNLIQQLLANAA